MDVVHRCCAGLDVSKKDVKVCVRVQGSGSRRTESRVTTWGSMTRQVMALRDELIAQGVSLVVMEATGDYWKPFFYVLEEVESFETILVNPSQVRAIPGRKSDVSDAAWLADLGAHGLVRASFVPPAAVRELRNLTRARTVFVQDRTREWSRLEKLLEDAGIKVSVVASKLPLVSVRRMLDALVAGQRDPRVLANLAAGPLRRKIDLLNEALFGRFNDHHALLIRLHLAVIDELDVAIAELDEQIEAVVNQEPFRSFLQLICTIPGIDARVSQVVAAEIGTDMSVFPTPGHLASWAGVVPGMNSSAGRTKSTRARPGDRHLKAALGMAAAHVPRATGTLWAAKYKRIKARAGSDRANVAMQHAMLVAIWHMATTGELWRDLGADYHQRRRDPDQQRRRAIAQLETLGYAVSLEPLEQAS